MSRSLARSLLVLAAALSGAVAVGAQPAASPPGIPQPGPLPPKPAPVVVPPPSAQPAAKGPKAAPTPPASAPAAAAPGPAQSGAAADGDAAQLPPGHPPVAGAAAPADPALPPGHPPAGGGRAGALPTSSVLPDASLPVGTIAATILDGAGAPMPGVEVRLGVLRQTVAEGDERSFATATTDAAGAVTFKDKQTGSAFSYRVTVRRDAAEYASTPFNLGPTGGMRVKLHVYPVTRDINQAAVGMRGFTFIETRDDVFQFEVMFRVFNIGRVTWVPDGVGIDLPRGFKGFTAQESMTDTRAVNVGDRVELQGTYTPGQHDVIFRFQVPNDHDERVDFDLGLPPHVAEMRVIAAAAKGMTLSVPGFDPAQPSTNEDGQRLLVTGRQLQPGEPELTGLTIALGGIPTPGPGRWIAAGLAAVAALLGLGFALGKSAPQQAAEADRERRDALQAQQVLLDELVALEQARRKEAIGPRTYEQARRALLDALARVQALIPQKKKGRAARA